MSVLEIIIYSILGIAAVIWTVIQIVNFKKGKKKPKKEDEED